MESIEKKNSNEEVSNIEALKIKEEELVKTGGVDSIFIGEIIGKFPERLSLLNELLNPNLSHEEFMKKIEDFNSIDNIDGGSYHHFSTKITPDREFSIKYYRDTGKMSVGGGKKF